MTAMSKAAAHRVVQRPTGTLVLVVSDFLDADAGITQWFDQRGGRAFGVCPHGSVRVPLLERLALLDNPRHAAVMAMDVDVLADRPTDRNPLAVPRHVEAESGRVILRRV